MVLYGAIDYSKSVGALLTEVRKTLSVMLTQVHAELVARRPVFLRQNRSIFLRRFGDIIKRNQHILQQAWPQPAAWLS